MMSFKLILQSGSGAGTTYPLEKNELFLGRDLSNDIVVNDAEVSRRHARLTISGNTYLIEDLGSTNGTFIRGQRLAAPVILHPGEMITIGEKVLLKFEVTGLATDATVAAYRPSQATVQPAVSQASYQALPQPMVPAPLPIAPSRPFVPVAPVQQVVTPAYYPVAPVNPGMQPLQSIKRKRSGWIVALLVVAAILVVFCLIPFLIIEITDSYCALFPGIFNSMQPGVCP